MVKLDNQKQTDSIEQNKNILRAMKQHLIALVDCDSFFVSCERVDNTSLCGKPVCVMTGGGSKGIIVSRSKEAKALGIKMGAPYFQVQKTHPQAICLPARHRRYSEISHQVMNTLRSFTPDVEEVSIDEAYVDLTGLDAVYKISYQELIKKIRQTVWQKNKIPVSVGLSTSKTLAKLASDKAKSAGGIYIIRPEEILESIGNDNINEICGIGRCNSQNLGFNGIFTVKDFLAQDNAWIKMALGIRGLNLKFELSGLAVSPVDTTLQAPQSIQDTKSFTDFSDNLEFLQAELGIHAHNAAQKLRHWNGFCAEVGVLLRTKDFKVSMLFTKLPATNSDFAIKTAATELLKHLYKPKTLYRSIGVELRKLSYFETQQSLFENLHREDDKLSKVVDELEQKFGRGIVKIGA